MFDKPVVIGILLVALIGVFWLLGGLSLFGGDPSGDGPGAGDPSQLDGADGGSPDDALPGADAAQDPMLFGRAREQRVGVGGLVGRVKNFQTGQPVPQASIVVVGTGYGGEKVMAQALTSDDGRFELGAVAAGDRYRLLVKGLGKYQRTYPSVAVDAGAEHDLRTIWLGERGLLLGTIADEAGKPIEGAQVQVFTGGATMMEIVRNFTKLFEQLDKDAEPLVTATSDARGRFRVEKLDPGPISLIVRAPGYVQTLQKEVMTSKGAAGGTVDIVLKSSAPLAGVVVDEHGRGVAGARIACLDKDDMDSVLYGRSFRTTDEQGRFRIDSPPGGGAFALIVTAAGFPMFFTETRSGNEELRLVLESGAELLVRLLEKGTNRPVEDAHLMGMFGGEDAFAGGEMNLASGVTDHRGEVSLHVRPGKLQMLFMSHAELGRGVFAPMMVNMGATSILAGPDDVSIKKPRTTMVFHVQSGVAIRGVVTGPESEPIEGARVLAMGSMGIGGDTTTDAEGRYELTDQSTPVTAVIVTADGYVQDLAGYEGIGAEAGRDIEFDAKMLRAATVSGRVIGPDGRPLAGVRVKVASNTQVAMLAAITGSTPSGITATDGSYVLTGANPDKEGAVMARLAGFLDSKCPTFAIEGGAANHAPDLVMKRGSRLLVRVHRPEGGAAPGARVEVSVESPDRVTWDPMGAFRSFADLVTDDAGQVEVRDLPDGKLTVTASRDGFASSRDTFEIKLRKDGSPHRMRMSLREGYKLVGKVVDAEGKPAAKVRVECNPIQYGPPADPEAEWAPNAEATTDAQGRFEIPDMPDMPLELEAAGEGYQKTGLSIAGPRGEVEIRINRMDPEAKARIAEIDKELTRIYQQWAAAKTEAEKGALQKRIQVLQIEKAGLESGKSSAIAEDAADGD